eukprot:gene20305-24314_t
MGIEHSGIRYKEAWIDASNVLVSQNSGGKFSLKFTIFVPQASSEWVPDATGLEETFKIQFSADGDSFRGTFQRQGEGGLTANGIKTGNISNHVVNVALPAKPTPNIADKDFQGFGCERTTAHEAVAEFPQDAQFLGTYSTEITWNGDNVLQIERHRIVFKETNVCASDVLVTQRNGCARLRFTIFIPGQTSEWVPGVTGLSESFDINFSETGFEGIFRRHGEGTLSIKGTLRVSLEERSKKLPTVERLARQDSLNCCPVCYETWGSDFVQVQTECGHCFCMGCIVSICNLTPPVTTGVCAMCRSPVTLKGLKRVKNSCEEDTANGSGDSAVSG